MDLATLTLISALAGGNPGAITVMAQLSQEQLMTLAEVRVKGSKIWELYKDVCGEDIELLKSVLDDAEKCGNLHDAVARHVPTK